MPAFWIIVARGQQELLDALSAAFGERPGFTVIQDRREARRSYRPAGRGQPDRRGTPPDAAGGFLVAERQDLIDS